MAVNFDPATDDNYENTSFPWAANEPVTVTFWNYAITPDVKSFAFGVGGVAAQRFAVSAPWDNGQIYWDYGDIGTGGRINTSYVAYMDAWHHVALVSEGALGAFKAIYVDGGVIASAGTSYGPTIALTGMEVGKNPETGAGVRTHKGYMEDFRIYNRALSAEEITQIYQMRGKDMIRKSLKHQAKLFGHPIGSSPTTIVDASGNGYDLTKVNTPTMIEGPGMSYQRRVS